MLRKSSVILVLLLIAFILVTMLVGLVQAGEDDGFNAALKMVPANAINDAKHPRNLTGAGFDGLKNLWNDNIICGRKPFQKNAAFCEAFSRAAAESKGMTLGEFILRRLHLQAQKGDDTAARMIALWAQEMGLAVEKFDPAHFKAVLYAKIKKCPKWLPCEPMTPTQKRWFADTIRYVMSVDPETVKVGNYLLRFYSN